MAVVRLTKRKLDSARCEPGKKQTYLWCQDNRGLGVWLTRSGGRSFVFQYTFDGRLRIATLGRADAMTLTAAREMAAEYRSEVSRGLDPVAERRKEEEEERAAPTVRALAADYLEYLRLHKRKKKTGAHLRPRTLRGYEILFERSILPAVGNKRLTEVTDGDIHRLHHAMRDRPYAANRALALWRAFNRWCVKRRFRSDVAGLDVDSYPELARGAKKEVKLTPEQIRRFLDALDATRDEDPYAVAALRVLFNSGWRLREVLRLHWEDIGFESGEVRLLRTKSAEEADRGLDQDSLDTIRSLTRIVGSPYVFPGVDPRKPRREIRRTWTRVVRRAGLEVLSPELGKMRCHDLRHNSVSWSVTLGHSLAQAGASVGHHSPASTAIYSHFAPSDKSRITEERVAAMHEAAGVGRDRTRTPRASTTLHERRSADRAARA